MAKPQDPRITLLDTAVPLLKLRPAVEASWQQRANARRYIFSAEASTRIGEMMRDHVDMMVDNIRPHALPHQLL